MIATHEGAHQHLRPRRVIVEDDLPVHGAEIPAVISWHSHAVSDHTVAMQHTAASNSRLQMHTGSLHRSCLWLSCCVAERR